MEKDKFLFIQKKVFISGAKTVAYKILLKIKTNKLTALKLFLLFRFHQVKDCMVV